MKTTILLRSLSFSVFLSLSAGSLRAQIADECRVKSPVNGSESVVGVSPEDQSNVGKEMPVPGGVLFVTPAERDNVETVSSKEKRRLKRLKKQDRKEVADVIGSSVNTYLANAATVHALQRF